MGQPEYQYTGGSHLARGAIGRSVRRTTNIVSHLKFLAQMAIYSSAYADLYGRPWLLADRLARTREYLPHALEQL